MQRQVGVEGEEPEEEEEQQPIRAKLASGEPPRPNRSLGAQIGSLRERGGEPLPESARARLEPRFGHDFGSVRIYADGRAAESARALSARAYTVGRDIVFGKGHYRPGTPDGDRLLAHELTHVVQQGQGAPLSVMRDPDEPEERSLIGSRGIASIYMPRLRELLTTDFWGGDWAVTDENARDALAILRRRTDRELEAIVEAMEAEGLVDTLFSELSEEDRNAGEETLRRISNFRVRTETVEEGETTVTTTLRGSCDFEQVQEMRRAREEALEWLDRVIPLIDIYRTLPLSSTVENVREALRRYFGTTNVRVARYVRGQLSHIRSDLRNSSLFTVECHGDWDARCRGGAEAYAPGTDRERIVLCPGFFSGSSRPTRAQVETIIHELTHTQVGSRHIGDIAYPSERYFRHLSTQEALTNAASYETFVRDVATNTRPRGAPRDVYRGSCDGWRGPLSAAVATAERWNRIARQRMRRITPESLRSASQRRVQLLGGTAQSHIDAATEAYDTVDRRLSRSVPLQCEPDGGGRCDRYAVYWYFAGDLHVCPSWTHLGPDDQVVVLLSSLYGYVGNVDDAQRRRNYALLAQDCAPEGPPSVSEILGDPSWTHNLLSIQVTPHDPRPAGDYHESGTQHQRLSGDLPVYEGPPCRFSVLPFRCSVYFTVDTEGTIRPAPFTPPPVTVEFRYVNGPLLASHTDPRPEYEGPGTPLYTDFGDEFDFFLTRNGPLNTRFEIRDPDSATTRTYDDTIEVRAVRPCEEPAPEPGGRYA